MKRFSIIFIVLLAVAVGACTEAKEDAWRGTKITSISPTKAFVRDTITITGENFKPYNTNTVIFADGRVAYVVKCTPTMLKAIVPDSGVVNGPITVRVSLKEFAKSSQTFTIDKSRPVIISMSPDSGLGGIEVTIKGANFAESGNIVKFGDKTADIISQDAYEIVVKVPSGLTDGIVDVVVTSNGAQSKPIEFESGIIFRDNFDRANTDWADSKILPNPIGAAWSIMGGQFCIKDSYMASQMSGTTIFKQKGAELVSGNGHSFKLSADFRSDVAAGTVFSGIMINAQDNMKYYVIRISGEGHVQFLSTASGEGGWAVIFNQGGFEIKGGPTFYHIDILSEEPYVFDVKVTNSSGVIVFDQKVTDENRLYTGGYGGFYTLGDRSQYDNFNLLLK